MNVMMGALQCREIRGKTGYVADRDIFRGLDTAVLQSRPLFFEIFPHEVNY